MSKKILLSSLLLAMTSYANEYNYEVAPLVGYLWNSTAYKMDTSTVDPRGGLNDHPILGIEMQKNNVCSHIKPEINFYYGHKRADNQHNTTDVLTTSVNGVYEFNKAKSLTPFVKAGLGYEWYANTHPVTYDGLIIDAGMGLKANLTKEIAFKVEALYWYKMNDNNPKADNGSVNNVGILAGLSFAFGKSKDVKTCMTTHQYEQDETVIPVLESPEKVMPSTSSILTTNSSSTSTSLTTDSMVNKSDKASKASNNVLVNKDAYPMKATLHLNFKTGSDQIDSIGYEKIVEFASFLKTNTAYKVIITGFTDNTSTDAFNLVLSEKRAQRIKSILVKEGIASTRLSAVGKGSSMPIASNATLIGRKANRRIEVELIQ